MFVKIKEKLKKIKNQPRLHVQKPAAKKSEKLSQHIVLDTITTFAVV